MSDISVVASPVLLSMIFIKKFAALLIVYPFYVLILAVLCSILISPVCLLTVIPFPFLPLYLCIGKIAL
jgi:hypothetical protein